MGAEWLLPNRSSRLFLFSSNDSSLAAAAAAPTGACSPARSLPVRFLEVVVLPLLLFTPLTPSLPLDATALGDLLLDRSVDRAGTCVVERPMVASVEGVAGLCCACAASTVCCCCCCCGGCCGARGAQVVLAASRLGVVVLPACCSTCADVVAVALLVLCTATFSKEDSTSIAAPSLSVESPKVESGTSDTIGCCTAGRRGDGNAAEDALLFAVSEPATAETGACITSLEVVGVGAPRTEAEIIVSVWSTTAFGSVPVLLATVRIPVGAGGGASCADDAGELSIFTTASCGVGAVRSSTLSLVGMVMASSTCMGVVRSVYGRPGAGGGNMVSTIGEDE